MTQKRNYWISWWQSHQPFEMAPWWVSGWRCGEEEDQASICAAVQAESEEAAKAVVLAAHDAPTPDDLDWRFVVELADNWTPYNSRFPQAEWMPDWHSPA